MPKETLPIPNVKHIIGSISGLREFHVNYANAPEQCANSRASRLSRALGTTAQQLVERRKANTGSNYLDYQHSVLNIVSLLPRAIDSLTVLDAPKGTHEIADINQAKGNMVELNHAIRGIIDSRPSLTRPQLRLIIGQIATDMLTIEQTKRLQIETSGIITGMQQEIFTEQALWTIDGVDVDEGVSIEDDLHGVDIRFDYKGQQFALDVKSREEDTRSYRPNDGAIRFWTGLNGFELGHKFRANDEQLEIIRARLMSILEPDTTSIARVS